MRSWIEYLVTNPTMGADFIAWNIEIVEQLSKKLLDFTLNGEIEKAKNVACEINVYMTMRSRIEAEMRERTAQAQYQDKNERS